jgi:hypothetical protein
VKGADQKQTSISSEASVKMGLLRTRTGKLGFGSLLEGKRMNSNSVPSNLLQGKKKENRQAFAKRM